MRYVTRYAEVVILSIRHKGLKRLYEDDDSRDVAGDHLEKLRDILARLDAAASPADMDLPGFRLHPLKGELRGSGLSPFVPTGALSSASPALMPPTWIISTIIEKERYLCP